jgi:serine/threonine protein kinase
MSAVPQVFISATSRDLGSFREAVSDVLMKLGAHPVIQEDFGPDHRSVVEMLREKVGKCDAVICLVGRRYGYEPLKRDADQPRQSYTQLEYEIAVELGKPVFAFVATDDCPLDPAPDEDDELRGLQLEHRKRIVASDRIRMQFQSLSHLTDQVRVMRFDPETLARGVTSRLAVLLFAELVDTEAFRAQRGDLAWVRDVIQPFRELRQESLSRWGGTLRAERSSEYEVNFETADAAVNAALVLHDALRRHGWQGSAPKLRVGIHLGQIIQFGALQAGHAIDECWQLTHLAVVGQTLLTRTAFEVAREHVRQAPTSGEDGAGALDWQSHGRYLMSDIEETMEVYEVGVVGLAPLTAPPDSPHARRADSIEQQRIPPWRPAIGQEIPRRPGWFLERKLGEGGFGEVWIARQKRNPMPRVFKFCFDATRLGSFKRELTLFRLLSEELGSRDDIARLLEFELEEGPYFLESEYVAGGNLHEWGESDGRLVALPLDERLRLITEIAGAVAAAHSVGIIHKDLKPSNVLMRQGPDGRWHPILADFGIGAIADRSKLKPGITLTGFERSLLEPGSSRTGTRMYQPPEASLARTATVQDDVYALGVMLYQVLIGDFDQSLGHGWERRLEAAPWSRGQHHLPSSSLSPSWGKVAEDRMGGSSPPPQPSLTEGQGDGKERMGAAGITPTLDPAGELVVRLLRDDIGDCVEGDPSARLASVAQLVERLQTLDKRVADGLARLQAERAARRMRRLRAALAASVAALIVVGGLGAFALMQWRRAERNAMEAKASAEVASRLRKLTLATLHTVIFEIQGSLQKLPGSSRVRSRFLGTALKQLEKLSGDYMKQSAVDRETAVALMEIADLILQFGTAIGDGEAKDPAGSTFGNAKGAVASARQLFVQSMEIFEALTKADPDDPEARLGLAIAYSKVGVTDLRLGETDRAMEFIRKGLKLYDGLARDAPDDAKVKRNLAFSYNSLGDVYMQAEKRVEAREAYQKGFDLIEALARTTPGDSETNSDLLFSYERLGTACMQQGDMAMTIDLFRKALTLSDAMVKANPVDPQSKRHLLVAYEQLGTICLLQGDALGAIPFFEKGLELSEALARADPEDSQARRDVAVLYNRLGDLHAQLGAADKALHLYQKVLALSEALAKADPADVRAKNDLAISNNLLAWFLATSWDDSIRDGRRALELATKACELVEWKAPNLLDTLAAAYAESGKFEDATKWQKKALESPGAFNASEIPLLEARLKLYETNQRYHQRRPEPALVPEGKPPSR